MTDAEMRVRDALAQVRAPECLKERTLAAIDRQRADEKDDLALVLTEPAPVARRAQRRLASRLAAAACLVLALLGGAYVALAPTAYVGIDVNPSIELAVNRFDRVVGARGVNDDGADVLRGADVMWTGCADALGAIGEKLEQSGYLDGGAELEVSVTCDDDRQYDAIEAACRERLSDASEDVSCSRASEEERHAAHECGMGVGKWRAWQDAAEAGADVSAEEAASMSMRELRDLCPAHEDPGASSGTLAESGGHHDGGRHRGGAHG